MVIYQQLYDHLMSDPVGGFVKVKIDNEVRDIGKNVCLVLSKIPEEGASGDNLGQILEECKLAWISIEKVQKWFQEDLSIVGLVEERPAGSRVYFPTDAAVNKADYNFEPDERAVRITRSRLKFTHYKYVPPYLRLYRTVRKILSHKNPNQ